MSPKDPRGCGTWNGWDLYCWWMVGMAGLETIIARWVSEMWSMCSSIHQPAMKEKETHIPCLSLGTSPRKSRVSIP